MDKLTKQMFIVIMIGAVALIALFLVLLGVFKIPEKKDTSSQRGEITQKADDYDPSYEFEAQSEDEAGVENNIVSIENPELIYNLLALQALQKLRPQLTKYLIMNGYDEDKVIFFMVDDYSVSEDRTYPYFEMYDRDDKNTVIQCHYDLDKYEWNFNFK